MVVLIIGHVLKKGTEQAANTTVAHDQYCFIGAILLQIVQKTKDPAVR